MTRARAGLAAAVLTVLSAGCASVPAERNFDEARAYAQTMLGVEPAWLASEEARRDAEAEVARLLGKPLAADDAVRIALAYSPAVQAVLAQSAGTSADIARTARLPNPVFAFERGVRRHDGSRELEIGRSLTVSLLDLVFLPSRLRAADHAQAQLRTRMSGDLLQAATETRQAWVMAVAAQQALAYHAQVLQAAQASAELARRMQSVGNFSKLQRAREQAFHADAVAGLARAQQRARATREALVRALGLNAEQAASLVLPERLPDLPVAPRDPAAIAKFALDDRLDVRLARAELERVAREQGLTRVASVADGLEVGGFRNSETGEPVQKGFELALPLPVFDFGDATRASAQATTMSAFHRAAQVGVEAASQVREAYGAYRTAYDLAVHYRDEIVPLRRSIADENLLRYNGMLIGVFELIADARDQIGTVVQALDAQRDFWLADAALHAALLGRSGRAAFPDSPSNGPDAASARGH